MLLYSGVKVALLYYNGSAVMVLDDVRLRVQAERGGRSMSNVYNYTGAGILVGLPNRRGDHAEACFLF